MYKILFFLHKTSDENIINFFNNKIVGKLREITHQAVEIASVENNFLLDQKYTAYCEVYASEQNEMNKLMNSKSGKELNKELADFFKNITVITVNYNK
jgi:hypothetical protein